MSRRIVIVSIAATCLLALLACAAEWLERADSRRSGPSRAHFDRLRIGMSLAEAEAILGSAGLSVSSDFDRESYIIQGHDGGCRVWVRQGKRPRRTAL